MTEISDKDKLAIGVVQGCYRAFDRDWKQLLDQNAQLPVTEARPPVDVLCTSGCAACCTYLVDVLESEAVVLAVAIQQADESQRQEALFRLLQWEHEFLAWQARNPRPEEVLLRVKDGRREASMNPAHIAWRVRWQYKRKACPFLNIEDYTCGVYEIRPTTCRGHHAATPPPDAPADIRMPPEGCFTNEDNVRTGNPTSIWQINNMLGEVWSAALAKQLGRHGLSWKPGLNLPLAVLAAGRERFGWPGPSDVGGTVPVLGVARKLVAEDAHAA